MVRVDHRLLHGQVIFSWTKHLSIDHIIVIDDYSASNQIAKIALSLAKPSSCKLDILSMDQMNSENIMESKDTIMIIVKNVETVAEIVKMIPTINEVNYGGIPKVDGSKSYGKAVFLTEDQRRISQELINNNIRISIQQIPSEQRNILSFD